MSNFHPTISFSLDKRYSVEKDLYQVRLCATFKVKKGKWVQRYFGLGVHCTVGDFKAAKSGAVRTDKQKKIKEAINKADRAAKKILDDHTIVTYDLFKNLFGIGELNSVGDVFDLIMKEKKEAGDIGSHLAYRSARNSLARFVDPKLPKLKTRRGEDTTKLNVYFIEINKDWIKGYKKWAANDGAGKTTIAIYLRQLRAVYNRGIDLGMVKRDMYPFGKRGEQIKKTQARKHRLPEDDIKRLLSFEDPQVQLGIDFWAFSYFSYGLNMADIANLKIKDLHDDLIVIERAKTIDTADGRLLAIPLRPEAKAIILRHGNKSLNPNDYVFPILSPGLKPMQVKNRVKDFTRKVNAQLKKAQEKLKLSVDPKSGNARHSFASLALEKGASKEFIQEALGHSSMDTTEQYLSGFGVKMKKAIGAKIYDS